MFVVRTASLSADDLQPLGWREVARVETEARAVNLAATLRRNDRVARIVPLDELGAIVDRRAERRIHAFNLCGVKFLPRLLTALNLLPSMATTASRNKPSCRLSSINSRQTFRMASPLSRRKSAIVLKSGASRPVSHMSSTLRCASRFSRRLDAMRFR